MANTQHKTFHPVLRLASSGAVSPSLFGPLTDLIGTWVGNKGFNIVALPNQQGRFVLLEPQNYYETLEFTPVSTPTPNRGTSIIQEVPALLYTLSIHNVADSSLLHRESGTWLLLPNCPSGFTIARQAVVPHGDSVLAIGSWTTTQGPPQIPDTSTVPIAGNPPVGYSDAYMNPQGAPGLTSKINPNETLREIIAAQQTAGQKIISTTTLNVSTENQGGIANIPFVVQNANCTQFEATYWIETVENPQTGAKFLQLQYSQKTILEFLDSFISPTQTDPNKKIKWPHVQINTLVKE